MWLALWLALPLLVLALPSVVLLAQMALFVLLRLARAFFLWPLGALVLAALPLRAGLWRVCALWPRLVLALPLPGLWPRLVLRVFCRRGLGVLALWFPVRGQLWRLPSVSACLCLFSVAPLGLFSRRLGGGGLVCCLARLLALGACLPSPLPSLRFFRLALCFFVFPRSALLSANSLPGLALFRRKS